MKNGLIALIICIAITAKAQNDAATIEEPDSWGDGNNTFSLNIKTLQSYFTKTHTVKQFEKTLAHFERRWYSSDTTWYNNYDSRKIVMPYINMQGDRIQELFLTYDAKQKITAIRFILEEDQARVDKLTNYIQKLKVAGYKQDVVYTRINRTLGNYKGTFLKHPTLKTSVSINIIDEQRSSIEFTK